MAVPRIEVSGLPAGAGLATPLGVLAAGRTRLAARVTRRDGKAPRILVASGDGELVARFPARLGGTLVLEPGEEAGGVRARLELAAEVKARLRAPGRRSPGQVPAGEIGAGSRGELAVTADIPADLSLRGGLARLARLARPGRWLSRPAPPPGTRWSLVHRSVLGLGASALLREALCRIAGGEAAVPVRIPAGIDLDARLETLVRTRVTFLATERGTVRGSLAVLGRHAERLAARSSLRLRVGDPDRLARTVLDAVLGPVPGLYERLAELELDLARVVDELTGLEERLRGAGARLAGPRSELGRVERALARAQDAVEIAGGPRGLRERIARAIAGVRSLRREIAAAAEGAGEAVRRVLRETRLDRLRVSLGHLLTRMEFLGDGLAREAAHVLAGGLSAELSAAVSRAREGSELVRVEMEPGRAASRRAGAALLAGRLAELAELRPGRDGIVAVTGRAVRAVRTRRSLALRLRVGARVYSVRRDLAARLSVAASWDGALAVEAGTRLSRRRQGAEGLAALVLDLGAAGGPGRVDPLFVLAWRETWPASPARRKRAFDRSPGLAAVAAATGGPPPSPPPGTAGLILRARLLPGDVRAMLRPSLTARRFAADAFWPAWLAALETAASRSSRNVLDPEGRHPLRDPDLRRALARDPSGSSLRDRFPRDLARETVAADYRVAAAILAALREVRRAAGRSSRNLAPLRRAADRLARAVAHHRTIDPVPLLFFLYLVPPRRRRLQLEWREPPQPPPGPPPPPGPDDGIPVPWPAP